MQDEWRWSDTLSASLTAFEAGACSPARRAPWRLRFVRRRDGAVTLEFALMTIPFIIFLFGVVEFVFQIATAAVLDTAAARAARFGVTGQNFPPGAPPNIKCRSEAIPWLVLQSSGGFLSGERLTVTMETFARLSDFTSGASTAGPGRGGDYAVYTLHYEQPLISGAWQRALGGAPNLLHRSIVTVRNEPFSNAPC